jgi:hypothetical protein
MKAFKILLILSVLCFACKKQRRISVYGTVTDDHTGIVVGGVKVQCRSFSHLGVSGGTSDKYYTYTNDQGEYFFSKIRFTEPAFIGDVMVSYEEEGKYIPASVEAINKSDAKFIGKTSLKRDLKATCVSKIFLTAKTNSISQVAGAYYSICYIGNPPNYQKATFDMPLPIAVNSSTSYLAFQENYDPGTVVIKSEYTTKNPTTNKTQFDTLKIGGCGSITHYTLYYY